MHARSCLCLLAAVFVTGGAAPAIDDPSPAAGTRPLLEQLTRETQALYGGVQRGVLRVQLPPPRWLDEGAGREASVDQDNPLNKYKGLDPKVREQLARRTARRATGEGEPLARADDGGPSTRPVSDADLNL